MDLAHFINSDNETPTLFEVPEQTRSRTSDVILSLIEQTRDGDVSLRTLTERLGDRTYGMVLVLLAVFNVLPLISILTGLLLAGLGLQMVAGVRRPSLPQKVLDRKLPAQNVGGALRAMAPRVRTIERYIRPRWHFTEAPIVDRINGIIIAVLGLIIMIPLPFTNLGPAIVILIMGLGLLERDGLVQVLAAGLAVLVIFLLTVFVFAS